jgi:prepilin-type N-terminal cleavage/methylation domain-containing protein
MSEKPRPISICRAFTLVELLVVISLIAILALLAIPNFLDSEIRAKVSRAKADFRTLATGLEVYRVDHGRFPKGNHSSRVLNPVPESHGYRPTLERLTTPVAYLTGGSGFFDVFKAQWRYGGNTLDVLDPIDVPPGSLYNKQLYWYAARNATGAAEWDQPNDPDPSWYYLESAGPDLAHHNAGTFLLNIKTDTPANRGKVGKMIYDPTNGTISRGSIWRVGGTPSGYATAFYYMVTLAYAR